MNRLVILLFCFAVAACTHMPKVSVKDGGAVVVVTKEDKFLLESGQIAYVDLGQKKGWLKISLQKNGWDRGSVTLYLSKSSGFEKTQSPYRIYTDEFDPCMIKLDDLAVTLVLTGGTVSASYIELVSGAEARLFRAKSPTRRQSQRSRLSRPVLRAARLAPAAIVAHL